MTTMWMVRAGRDSVYAEDFLQADVVAIGWSEMGQVDPTITREQLEEQYRMVYKGSSEPQIRMGFSQLSRFLLEFESGDKIVTYDRDKRIYYTGKITSDAIWAPEIIEEMPRARKVQWSQRVSRDRLSAEARNSLGAIMTLFRVKESFADELEEKAVPLDAEEPTDIQISEDEEVKELARRIREELIEKAEEAIEDRIVGLNWEEMQQLVAGLLRAMDYRTTVSRPGPDRGYDVFASPDGLGLEEPRIFVEVKHRPNQSMSSQEIRSFIGGRIIST